VAISIHVEREDCTRIDSVLDPNGLLNTPLPLDDPTRSLESGWTDPPTQVTTSSYDARNNRVALTDSVSGTTTTYDPEHNYAIMAFYVPTGSGKEHQTLYNYDSRHRLATTTDDGITKLAITEQLCAITSDHSCPSPITITGSDDYAYDDNDNRTTVDEDNGATSSTSYYCYDALNRLTARKSAAGCTGTTSESYSYDDAGNRAQSVTGGLTTNYAYDGNGQLCKVGGTSCATPNVTYDSAGRTDAYGGWLYEYDAEGRLVTACKSSSCVGSIDKVEFAYDGEGHRTQIKEYSAGTLTTTRDFRYSGDAIVEESTNGSVSRGYVVDEQGTVIKFCDPSCASPTTSYLVTWNGHGDALAAWQIESGGTLTLVNSYTYDSWGTPTTTVASGFGDLGFRFLYVGAHDVQWDDFSGLSLYYMHARHYSPAIGRFLQPDPARAEANQYGYAGANPVTAVDPSGKCLLLCVIVAAALVGAVVSMIAYAGTSVATGQPIQPGQLAIAAGAGAVTGASCVVLSLLGCGLVNVAAATAQYHFSPGAHDVYGYAAAIGLGWVLRRWAYTPFKPMPYRLSPYLASHFTWWIRYGYPATSRVAMAIRSGGASVAISYAEYKLYNWINTHRSAIRQTNYRYGGFGPWH